MQSHDVQKACGRSLDGPGPGPGPAEWRGGVTGAPIQVLRRPCKKSCIFGGDLVATIISPFFVYDEPSIFRTQLYDSKKCQFWFLAFYLEKIVFVLKK